MHNFHLMSRHTKCAGKERHELRIRLAVLRHRRDVDLVRIEAERPAEAALGSTRPHLHAERDFLACQKLGFERVDHTDMLHRTNVYDSFDLLHSSIFL